MCIIAAKPAGVNMPDRDTIRNMWDRNPDGAGIMYTENGKVQIEKGFMKYKSLEKALTALEKRLDLTKTPVVMHFRIQTHGGVSPENTHPFPITDSIGALRKLQTRADIGVAHNGIISSVFPRKGISDTMEYVATQLAPLKRALPKFYENKNALLLIQNAIQSRMVFLTQEGLIYTTGDFVTDHGILYSNTSYKTCSYRDLSWGCYGTGCDYEDDWNGYTFPGSEADNGAQAGSSAKTGGAIGTRNRYRSMCWLPDLDDASYVMIDGEMYEGDDCMLDSSGDVYTYDFDADLAVLAPGAQAMSGSGLPLHYSWEKAELVVVG